MRKSVSIAGLLLAWLCANGAVWDIVQVVAWGRMFSGYVDKMAVTAALRETFDASKPCDLCVTVAKAKDAGQPAAALPGGASSSGKLVLACDLPAPLVFANTPGEWPAALSRVAPTRTEAVPVPPPRV